MAPVNKSVLIRIIINKYNITECYLIILYYYYCAFTHARHKHTDARLRVLVYVNSIYYVIDSDKFAHFVIIRVYIRHNAYYLHNT